MIDAFVTRLADVFGAAQQTVFEAAVAPVMFAIGLGNLLEDAFAATGWLLVGVIEIAVLIGGIGALERWRPVAPVTDRSGVRTDILYTLVHRLGLFRVLLFFLVDPLWDWTFAELRLVGWQVWQLDELVGRWWPGVTDTAWFGLVAYLVVLDFAGYWIHRAQHAANWWWALHALHHSQREMTMWSDNRSHLLDDLIRDGILVMLAHAIGVAPGQFVAIVVCTQLLESLAHANVRIGFASLERLLVSPRYHRLHHAIGVGHESAGPNSLGGHNFAVLFPLWDIVFRSAKFADTFPPTGIRDQLPEHGGRDYGDGFWRQQWLGLRRLFGAR
ncbi:sterol desaturase family protein [Piscinibacter koreensis]|uniref:Sterol desaturase family protein n=1 Tax=Piscinibacter koreensis TaxID=2742824 RepID=A0A7Y6TYI6_9BURK|nr:sterol desaturase family protein [Schlegelella koreensis]NUZ08165.1 sterol desaturase family protein [Schlegelella koreensis]